jgi:AcrR family transcriptional regulator
MSRWAPDARGRLERAALELFEEQGFAVTTAAQIAERAGLTTRTLYRHFADKQDVLFSSAALSEQASRLMRDAPGGLDPLALVGQQLVAAADELFEGRRDHVRRVRDVVATDERLRERDQAKRVALSSGVRSGLAARGVDAISAALLGDLAVSVLFTAMDCWLDDGADDGGARPLSAHVRRVLDAHAALVAGHGSGPGAA